MNCGDTEGQRIQDRFYSMVDPEMRIPPIVRRMTGITNQMVRGAPTIDVIMPKFVEFCANHILVSHNTIGDLTLVLRNPCDGASDCISLGQ